MENAATRIDKDGRTRISALACVLLLCSLINAQKASAASLDNNGYTMSSTLSYTIVDTSAETFANSIYYNPNSVLGIAGNFHIVAFDTATVILNTHTNGNILANTLIANVNFGTNGIANEVSYIQRYDVVNATSGSSTAHALALGSTETVALEDNGNAFSVNGVKLNTPYHIYQDDDTGTLPFVDMDAVHTEVRNNSTVIGGYSDANVTADFSDENNRTITLDDPNAFGVYNTTASAMNGFSDRLLSIKGFSQGNSGSIVINIDCSGASSFTMPDLKMFFLDGSEAMTNEKTEFTEGRVLLNFINCNDTNIVMKITKASMLAPDANVTLSQNFNGTVIADHVTVNAESHRDDYIGQLSASPNQTSTVGSTSTVGPTNTVGPTVPVDNTPKTDDSFMPVVWFVLLLISTACFSLVLFAGKKNSTVHKLDNQRFR